MVSRICLPDIRVGPTWEDLLERVVGVLGGVAVRRPVACTPLVSCWCAATMRRSSVGFGEAGAAGRVEAMRLL
jgi:hypothetical protein